ncbi:MAG: EAL domain-containing protein [Gammaproteobacteria bacterium]|nr:EAL domain-containing protein [Gammaproteobacteria bacterium]MCK5262977.1 EAL domain-containing protein [Gammaproteobacteria bacterium]
MRFSLSIKEAWYGLILLVVLIPFVVLLGWGGLVFHDILLERSLQQEQVVQEMVHRSVQQEVLRLTTMLENKSDPMAYTLSHEQDEALLNELLKKVLSRESSIHALLLLKPDGGLIAGREFYNTDKTDIIDIKKHWDFTSPAHKAKLAIPMQGKVYIGSTEHHLEGVFFSIAVPVGSIEKPLGVLLAEMDANIMWSTIKHNADRDAFISYIVDANGRVLVSPKDSHLRVTDDASMLPLVNSVINNQLWQTKQSYTGIRGKKVFGSSLLIENLGWTVVTEIEQETILQPIRELLFKLAAAGTVVVILFLILGMHLVKRVVIAIQRISNDFSRIENQDFTPSRISSSLEELDGMVNGFNRMVKEIARRQQSLNQAAIVFDNTSEGIIITDAKGYIESVNSAFSDITGYRESELIGRNPSLLQSGLHDECFYQEMWQSIEKNGQWQGEIQNRRKNGEIYTELLSINSFRDDDDAVIQYVGVITDISSIKQTEHKLEYLAHHDPLTDLPNRLLCNARLEHELQVAQRHDELVAVMFIDLDMFKNINDSLGHALGDKLLKKVAARISKTIRNEDTVSRLGGDEFVLIIGSLKSKLDAAQFSENILELFKESFVIDEHEVFIGASIGISVFPQDGRDTETLLKNSDAAMYRAKKEGRNNCQFYTPDLTSNACERLSMETYLRHALENNELVLHYQPQYSFESGQIIAVEALLRWQHPEHGLIYPDKFISVAEETGLIVPIGEWVLETACKQLIKWKNSDCMPLRMAVNLSARQFWNPGLATVVQEVLKNTGVQPCDLDLELTESIIMHDTKITEDALNTFHEMGVELSIDDFGTGYSSLSYLKRFPIDRLKIDRSFVRDITTDKNDADMINSIIALGHCMGLKVLAEGVETEEQLNYLKEHGCDEVQGYYYSRPVAAEEIEVLLYEKKVMEII